MSSESPRARLLEDTRVRRAVEAAAAFLGTPVEPTRHDNRRITWQGQPPEPASIVLEAQAGRVRVVRWCPTSEDEADVATSLVTQLHRHVVSSSLPGVPYPQPDDPVRWEISERYGHVAFRHSLILAPLLAPGADEATRQALAELRATVRPELGQGTIAQAAFDGRLTAPEGMLRWGDSTTGDEQRWRWLTLLPSHVHSDDVWMWGFWIDLIQNGVHRHEFHTRSFSPRGHAQLHPDWRGRLAALAQDPPPDRDAELDAILAALSAPGREDSLAHWYRTRALPALVGPLVDRDGAGPGSAEPDVARSLRGTGRVTSACTADGSTRTLYAEHLPPTTLGEDWLRVVLLTRRPGEPSERVESDDIFDGYFSPGVPAEYEPLPERADEAAALAQVERFREALAVCLSSADPPDFDAGLSLGEFFHANRLPRLLFEALREGPPPTHPPMSGTLGEHARASARSLRRIEGQELDELRWRHGRGGSGPDVEEDSAPRKGRSGRGRPARRAPRRPPPADIVAAFEVAGWTLLFSMDLGQCDGFFEDSFCLVRDQHTHLVLVTDPWDRDYPLSVDGDDATWRLVATWLAGALRDRGLDVVLRKVDEDDEDDEDDEEPLSDWVLGKRREPRIVLDWRLSGRILSLTPYPGGQIIVLGDSPQETKIAAAREAYDQFVRDVIDPGFTR